MDASISVRFCLDLVHLFTAAVDKSCRLDYKRYALFFKARDTRTCSGLFKCAVGLAVPLQILRIAEFVFGFGFCG